MDSNPMDETVRSGRIEATEDVEGHRVSRVTGDDDVEGHGIRGAAVEADEGVDTEGHGTFSNSLVEDGDDTEGHARFGGGLVADDPDVEGHGVKIKGIVEEADTEGHGPVRGS